MKENLANINMVREILKKYVNVSDVFKQYKRFDDHKWMGDGIYVITCPFHADDSPSLNINDNIGKFHCFSCGAGGDAGMALVHLAKNIDHIHYSYARALDILIKTNLALREALPFDSVIEDKVTAEDIITRPKAKSLRIGLAQTKTMNDVYDCMRKLDKTSFMDVAYITSMMVAKQMPEQMLYFLGAGQEEKPAVTMAQTSAVTVADLLRDMDWGDE